MDKIRAKKILIDTNVLVYSGDTGSSNDVKRGFSNDARKLLRTLKDNNNLLAISELTCFELMRNSLKNEEANYYSSLINYIDRIPVDTDILQNAAAIGRLYAKSVKKTIKSPDLILGATVVTEMGALLLTANRSDFPLPFWRLVSQSHFMRKKDEGDELVNIFLLEFDYSILERLGTGAVNA